jgi:DNA-binding LytR/AlgR family response regulator
VKIIIEDRNQEDEDEVIIRCKELDETLLKLINALKMGYQKITATKDGNIVVIDPKDIYYFEAVDNKVFVYTKHEVYETKRKLYEIEQEFEGSDFFRASKSTILNLSKVKSLMPAFSGRFEASLLNSEKVMISRQYVSILKRKLDL